MPHADRALGDGDELVQLLRMRGEHAGQPLPFAGEVRRVEA